MARLVELNFPGVRVWHHGPQWTKEGDPGDKHGPPVVLDGMAGYLLCTKHPLAWVESMLRYRPAAVSDLVRRWNGWCRAAVAFGRRSPRGPHPPVAVVGYEELLTFAAGALAVVGRRLGLPAFGHFTDEPNTMLRGGDAMRGDDAVGPHSFDRREWYLEEKWREALPPEMRARAKALIDVEATEAIGYEVDW